MKIIFSMLLTLLTISANAGLWLEGAVNYDFSSSEISKLVSPNQGKNSDTAIGLGAGLTGRAGFSFPFVRVGAVGLVDWGKTSMKYAPDSSSLLGSNTYSMTTRNSALGLTAVGKILILRVIGEYFPYARRDIIGVGSASERAFNEGDHLKGSGWGLGLGYELGFFTISGLYRHFTYDKGTILGSSQDLPSSNFSESKYKAFVVELGFSI